MENSLQTKHFGMPFEPQQQQQPQQVQQVPQQQFQAQQQQPQQIQQVPQQQFQAQQVQAQPAQQQYQLFEYSVRFFVQVGRLTETHRCYDITIEAPKLENGAITPYRHTFETRFSNINKACYTLPSKFYGRCPSTMVFTNYKTNESNCKKRANEIKLFLEYIYSENHVLGLSDFHTKLGLEPCVVPLLHDLLRAKKQEAERKRIEIANYWHSLYLTAQNFMSNAAVGTMPILIFNREMNFYLKRRWGGNGEIYGPNGKAWFKVQNLSICTMSGVKLMSVYHEFTFFGMEYSLARFGPSGSQLWCAITRHSTFGVADYEVAPKTNLCPRICMEGSWRAYSATFVENGRVACRCTDAGCAILSLSHHDPYCVTVYPGFDVVLYLALSFAIERMHHRLETRDRY